MIYRYRLYIYTHVYISFQIMQGSAMAGRSRKLSSYRHRWHRKGMGEASTYINLPAMATYGHRKWPKGGFENANSRVSMGIYYCLLVNSGLMVLATKNCLKQQTVKSNTGWW